MNVALPFSVGVRLFGVEARTGVVLLVILLIEQLDLRPYSSGSPLSELIKESTSDIISCYLRENKN